MTTHKLQVFSTRSLRHPRRQWYWRLVAPNGRTVADSSEGYHNRKECEEMARSMPERFAGARWESSE